MARLRLCPGYVNGRCIYIYVGIVVAYKLCSCYFTRLILSALEKQIILDMAH